MSSTHPRGHRIAYSEGKVSRYTGKARTIATCECGKRMTGWDHGEVIRRVVRHHDEIRPAKPLRRTR